MADLIGPRKCDPEILGYMPIDLTDLSPDIGLVGKNLFSFEDDYKKFLKLFDDYEKHALELCEKQKEFEDGKNYDDYYELLLKLHRTDITINKFLLKPGFILLIINNEKCKKQWKNYMVKNNFVKCIHNNLAIIYDLSHKRNLLKSNKKAETMNKLLLFLNTIALIAAIIGLNESFIKNVGIILIIINILLLTYYGFIIAQEIRKPFLSFKS